MKFYNLKKDHEKSIEQISLINPIINDLLYAKLHNVKKKIDLYPYKWDKYKSIHNKYEYIYQSSSSIVNICKIIPISRSFFKLHEILIDLNIKFSNNSKITCIAEGPGGFIQSLLYNIPNHIKYNIYGITLLSKSMKIPYWSSLIINRNNINLLKGIDKTGDICNIDNIKNFIEIIGENTCEFITSDGGIDYSDNYNSQENSSYNLIFFEIYIALQIQKNNGTFILKMFDILLHRSIQLLYILYQCYDEIIIYKPSMSRDTNSEKYIICKNYKRNRDIIDILDKNISKINSFYLNIPESFIDDINRYNDIIVNNQINNIDKIIDNIKSKTYIRNNPNIIQTSIGVEWCNQYKLPINKLYT